MEMTSKNKDLLDLEPNWRPPENSVWEGKPAVTYPGSKSRISDWILEHIPDHELYCEPFSGMASVFFSKNRSQIEVLNDRNKDTLNLLQQVRDHPDELADYLRRTPYSREQYDDWADRWHSGWRPEGKVKQAAVWFYILEAGFVADINTKNGFSRSSNKGGSKFEKIYQKRVDRLNRVADRLRGVTLECLDYRDVVEKYDTEETAFYFDPPYYDRQTDYGASDFQHTDLRDTVVGIDADIIISYDDLPPCFVDLAEKDNWNVYERDTCQSVSGTPKKVTERLVANYDSGEEPRFTGQRQQSLSKWSD